MSAHFCKYSHGVCWLVKGQHRPGIAINGYNSIKPGLPDLTIIPSYVDRIHKRNYSLYIDSFIIALGCMNKFFCMDFPNNLTFLYVERRIWNTDKLLHNVRAHFDIRESFWINVCINNKRFLCVYLFVIVIYVIST